MISKSLNYDKLSAVKNTPIDFATLISILPRYKSPKDKIASLEKKEMLIRLKKGLFVVHPSISREILSKELIANHLYGPSYISLESALSYHHLIPERVYQISSVTMKRGKKYHTSLGVFNYQNVPVDYFSIGVEQKFTESQAIFLIATPEKALCDQILLTKGLRLQSVKSIKLFLEEDLRIDLSERSHWDIEIIKSCISVGKKKNELTMLLKLLQSYG